MERMLHLALAACVLAPVTVCAQSTTPDHSMVPAAELKWVDLPSLPTGAQATVLEGPMDKAMPFTARLRLPANYRIPPHTHPAIEHVSVLSGTLYMGLGEKLDTSKGMPVRRGDFAVMQPGTPHFAYTTSEPVELQLHGVGPWGITYLNPTDDPRKKLP
jgi:mannose-6-phosphate isomerase-like protein (cupin superfamily)